MGRARTLDGRAAADSGGKSVGRESTQHKLDRVRAPRVQITYDVEIGDAIEIKELPFVVGVLGDFTGQPEQPLPKLKERKFVEINPDNFDSVLDGMKPHLAFSVENKLSDDPEAANLKVDLRFKSMEDFEPANVARQVKPLKELLDLRTRLSDLRGKLRATTTSTALARRGQQRRQARKAQAKSGGEEVAPWRRNKQRPRPRRRKPPRKSVCSIRSSSRPFRQREG